MSKQIIDFLVSETFTFCDSLNDIALIDTWRVEDIPLRFEHAQCFFSGGRVFIIHLFVNLIPRNTPLQHILHAGFHAGKNIGTNCFLPSFTEVSLTSIITYARFVVKRIFHSRKGFPIPHVIRAPSFATRNICFPSASRIEPTRLPNARTIARRWSFVSPPFGVKKWS